VLELGIGGGLNLAFYDPARVQSVTGVDPSEGLRRPAQAAPRPATLKVEILAAEAEALPFARESFDSVVCTFTLCSVHTPAAVLAEARRVLKPAGAFRAFLDAPGRRLPPHPSSDHFDPGRRLRIEDVETMYLPKAPRALGWCEWGLARPG
jgi:ubiquinone/menaquinone biosynthesis C-methylase UbiE